MATLKGGANQDWGGANQDFPKPLATWWAGNWWAACERTKKTIKTELKRERQGVIDWGEIPQMSIGVAYAGKHKQPDVVRAWGNSTVDLRPVLPVQGVIGGGQAPADHFVQ